MPIEMNARKIIKKYHGTKETYEDSSSHVIPITMNKNNFSGQLYIDYDSKCLVGGISLNFHWDTAHSNGKYEVGTIESDKTISGSVPIVTNSAGSSALSISGNKVMFDFNANFSQGQQFFPQVPGTITIS